MEHFNKHTPVHEYVQYFVNEFNDANVRAIKILFRLRDIRNGRGEKHLSRVILFSIKIYCQDLYKQIAEEFVVKYGCFKDFLIICDWSKKWDNDMSNSFEINLFARYLKNDNELCAKWAPNEKSVYNKYPLKLANGIAKKMHLNMCGYRKHLTKLRDRLNILESNMCNNTTEYIKFEELPSKALQNHVNAFSRDVNKKGIFSLEREELMDRFFEYNKVNKYNHPMSIVKEYKNEISELQWKNVVENVQQKETLEKTMAVIDSSLLSKSFGILLSECSEHPFDNRLINSDDIPEWIDFDIHDNLEKRIQKIDNKKNNGNEVYIYDIYNLILGVANMHNLSKDRMIEKIFICTDKEINYEKISDIENEYNNYGYDLPELVYLIDFPNYIFTKNDTNESYEIKLDGIFFLGNINLDKLQRIVKN